MSYIAIGLESVATIRLEAIALGWRPPLLSYIAIGLESVATIRLEAIASRLEATAIELHCYWVGVRRYY